MIHVNSKSEVGTVKEAVYIVKNVKAIICMTNYGD